MLAVILIIPFAAAGAALALRSSPTRLALLIGTAAAHAGLVAVCWVRPPAASPHGWLALDPLGLLFLSLVSALFLCAALYSIGYLGHAEERSNRVFVACLLGFLGAMSLVTISQHLGLLWVAVEATTLASAPLIYFHRSQRSLEATWKYLLICSVGIALALLGTFFLAVAGSPERGGEPLPLVVGGLVSRAPLLQVSWLKGAFLFLLVGYGTKMGLAPLHTWLPDAHSEAPSPASALLSGALLNCAFLGILRGVQICEAAGEGPFARRLLVVFGLLSLAVAGAFMVGQADFKRMLAYSSVEHMGILALGVGLGGAAAYGAMLHAVNHSLTKAMLFFAAGNIVIAYRTKSAAEVRGVLRRLPVSGALLVGGFLAIIGSPPFGPFLSEFTILNEALAQGRFALGAGYLALLAVAFLGMGAAVLPMAQGSDEDAGGGGRARHAGPGDDGAAPGAMRPAPAGRREPWLLIAAPLALFAAVLVLGVYVPAGLRAVLEQAARLVGGAP